MPSEVKQVGDSKVVVQVLQEGVVAEGNVWDWWLMFRMAENVAL